MDLHGLTLVVEIFNSLTLISDTPSLLFATRLKMTLLTTLMVSKETCYVKSYYRQEPVLI